MVCWCMMVQGERELSQTSTRDGSRNGGYLIECDRDEILQRGRRFSKTESLNNKVPRCRS